MLTRPHDRTRRPTPVTRSPTPGGGFTRHELCDMSSEWLNGANIGDLTESYHPTASGQSGGYLPAMDSITG